MKKNSPANLKNLGQMDGVTIINICEWLSATYGEEFWDNRFSNPDYEDTGTELMEWCADHNAAYWAAPREDFNIEKAVAFARERGNRLVVVEDLS